MYAGDCLDVARTLAPELAGKVALVFLDPPFGTGSRRPAVVGEGTTRREVPAYADGASARAWSAWEPRLRALAALLAPDGTLVLHCDWRWSHRFRCLLDDVFGADAFLNEVVWAYGAGARGAKGARSFARNHDVLLWYRRGRRWTFNGDTVERAWPVATAGRRGFQRDEAGRWFKTAPRGDYSDASVARLEAEGRIYRTRTGKVRVKYPVGERDGLVIDRVEVGDVWTDIPDAMHLPAGEGTGFATQKPLALLERWIRAATRPGDLVLDPCVGSGTTLLAAHALGRRWVGIDAGALALHTTWCRLVRAGVGFRTFGEPPATARAVVHRVGGEVHLHHFEDDDGVGLGRVAAWAVGPDEAPFRPERVAVRQAGALPTRLPARAGPVRVRVASETGAVAWTTATDPPAR